MPDFLRIGIIGGNGWLGRAIARALVDSGVVGPERLTLSRRSGSGSDIDASGAFWTFDNAELVERSDIVILSVRPEQFSNVRIDVRGKLLISVMAGVSVSALVARTGATRIVRAIPNAAASLRKSFTPWFASASMGDEDKAVARSVLSAFGQAEESVRESDIDYCVGLTGSGAAFPALLAQAMREAALARGLSPDFARRAAIAIAADASQLLQAEGADPERLVQEMIDYRGTTAAALEAMRPAFTDAVRAGLEAAAEKGARMALE